MIISPKFYKTLLAALSEHPPAIYLGGLISLGVGFLLVTFHNIWIVNDWTVIITILGWVAFIKGLIMLLVPNAAIKTCAAFDAQLKKLFIVCALIIIIAGTLLAWLGFFCQL